MQERERERGREIDRWEEVEREGMERKAGEIGMNCLLLNEC